ncbi:PorV/PorQ family protein [bacterium]
MMRFKKLLLTRFFIGCFILSVVFIYTSFNALAVSTGETGMNFLKIANDVRGVGMGEANAAVADTVCALVWNPAGLAQLHANEAHFMYNKWFQGISSQYVSCALPIYKTYRAGHAKNYGTVGMSVNYLSIEPIQGYDIKGDKTEELNAYDVSVSLAYARRLYKALHGGFSFKYLYETLADVNAQAFAVDIGLLIKTLTGVGLGFTVQNLGTNIKFIEEEGKLPENYKLGVSYNQDIFNQPLTIAFDVNMPNDNDVYCGVGLEYWIKDIIAVRSGYRSGMDVGEGLRLGMGIKTNLFQMDYAFAGFGELGSTHRIGVTMRFGQGANMNRIAELYNRGYTHFEQGRYSEAIRVFNYILKIEPKEKKALNMLQKSYKKLSNELNNVDRSRPSPVKLDEPKKKPGSMRINKVRKKGLKLSRISY